MKGDTERAADRLTREGKCEAMDTKGNGESSVRRQHARRRGLPTCGPLADLFLTYSANNKITKRLRDKCQVGDCWQSGDLASFHL